MPANITHCLFDMDGLLIDTERIYTEATQEFLDKYQPGTKFTWELKSKLMGTTAQESARLFLEATKIDISIDDYIAETIAIQQRLFPTTQVLPGVERLIRHLHAHKIPTAVATSSTRSKFALKTSAHSEIFALFDSITCGDDKGIDRGKPAPDLFLAARAKFGGELPPTENCLVFEDATNGVQAAHAAGMPAIWVPDPNLRALPREAEFVEPTETLDSLEFFDPSKYGLPAWDS